MSEAQAEPVEIEEREERAAFQETDVANAHRVAKSFANDLRWVKGLGWLDWTGTHWEVSETRALARVQKLGQIVLAEAAILYRLAAQSHDPVKRDEITKKADARRAWARQSEAKDRIKAALDLARPHLEIAVEKLDADPWLLPVANGAIELRTGAFREHHREDLCTKIALVTFDPNAHCPIWRTTLGEIFESDAELISYLQRLAGLCLTGVTDKSLHFFCGEGDNGKNVITDTLCNVLGPFAVRPTPDLLMATHGDKHPTELLDLRGARLAVCAEVEQGRRWASARMKYLTGERRIRARAMRQDFVEFDVTHKLVVTSNHRPDVDDHTHAFWSRMRVVPFARVFTKAEQKTRLIDQLSHELPGILNWMLAGLGQWRETGLGEAPAIQRAVAQYRGKSDTIASFLAACCRTGPELRVGPGELYDAHKAWASERSVKPADAVTFRTRMAELFKRSEIDGKVWWHGLELCASPDTAGDDDRDGHARPRPRTRAEAMEALSQAVTTAGGWEGYLRRSNGERS